MSQFAATLSLVRPIVRRDRTRLLIWSLAILVLVVVTILSTKDLYPTQADLDAIAAATKGNPAAAAFNGPPVALDTIGGQVAFQLGATGLTIVGLMSVLLMQRITRGEEESGRLELVRALPVGRHAPLLAAVAVCVGLDTIVGALTTVALVAFGLPVAGSIAFGMSFAVLGWVFVGLTAVTAQVTANPRTAGGIAGAARGGAYALRAAGDAGVWHLSWLSPIGWAQKARPYAHESWWLLLVCLAVAAGLVATAVWLSARRDYGLGLLPSRAGPAHAGRTLASSLGLTVRLERAAVLWWSVGTFVLALVCGSLAGSIKDFLSDNQSLADFLNRTGGVDATDAYLALSLLLLALVAAGAAVQVVLRAHTEEVTHRAEPVLATATSRRAWLCGHIVVAAIGSVIALLAGAVGLGVSASASMGDASQLGRLTVASFVYVPALLAFVGLAAALVGRAPRAVLAVWGLWSFSLVLAMFGSLVDFPDFVRDLSPFDHIPAVPGKALRWLPILVLTALSAALGAVATRGMRRRDIA